MNLVIPVVVIMTPGITTGTVHQVKAVASVKSMNTGLRTHVPWPIWPVRVSHRMPAAWLGKLHSEKNRCRAPVRGHCTCFGEVRGSKDGRLACSG